MALKDDIAARIDAVQHRIELACARAGRDPATVELVAVSKKQPEEKVRAAYEAGLRVFAENYAQELARRADALSDLPQLRWRFVGHLQRNKIKLVQHARASVDTLDSLRLAEALSARAAQAGAPVEVLLQVNVGREPQKSGCAPEDVPSLAAAVRALPGLQLHGLMTVAPHFDAEEDARPVFAELAALGRAENLGTLSMGMSHDLEAAILEGATMVRVGTALFGERLT